MFGFRLTGFPSFEHLLVFLQSPISYLFTKNISFLTIFWILLKLHKNTCNGTFKKAMASQNLFPKYLLQLLSKMLQNYPQMRICLRCLKRPSLQKGEIINKKEQIYYKLHFISFLMIIIFSKYQDNGIVHMIGKKLNMKL